MLKNVKKSTEAQNQIFQQKLKGKNYMGNELEIGKKLYSSKNGAFCIYEAMYKNEPCYCIEHTKTLERVLFDGGDGMYRSLVAKLNRQRLVRDGKGSGSGFMFKFNGNGANAGISLRSFLWCRYNKLPLSELKWTKIELRDKSAYADRIMDMRQYNLYDAGGVVTDGVSIETDCATGKQFVVAQDEDRTEFMDYSPEIYQILTTRNYSTFQKSMGNGRLAVSVHFANRKDGYTIKNLSRFVAIYNQHFRRFKNQRGNVLRFLHNFQRLDPGKNIEAGHINSCNWNNCAENLMFMPAKKNSQMWDIARRISGEYKIFPVVYRGWNTPLILVEWTVRDTSKHIVCESVDDYIDLLLFATKRVPMSQHIRLQFGKWDGEKIATQNIPTPKDSEIQYGKMPILDYRETVLDMLNWSAHKDALVKLYEEHPDYFWTWKCMKKGVNTGDCIAQSLLIFT